jgi:hypothetical protein
METVDMRKELHQYIDEGDDRLIRMVYAIIKEYNEDDEYQFTEEEIKQFNERRERWLLGEGKTYTWEEVKQSILSGKRL